MTLAAETALIRRWWDALSHGTAATLIDDVYAPDYVLHDPNVPDPVHGRDGVRAFIAAVSAAFPDADCTLEDLIAAGDRIVQRVTFRGTQHGDFLGVPATGKPIAIWVIVISRMANGQIAEEWQLVDMLGMRQQLGALPTAEDAG